LKNGFFTWFAFFIGPGGSGEGSRAGLVFLIIIIPPMPPENSLALSLARVRGDRLRERRPSPPMSLSIRRGLGLFASFREGKFGRAKSSADGLFAFLRGGLRLLGGLLRRSGLRPPRPGLRPPCCRFRAKRRGGLALRRLMNSPPPLGPSWPPPPPPPFPPPPPPAAPDGPTPTGKPSTKT